MAPADRPAARTQEAGKGVGGIQVPEPAAGDIPSSRAAPVTGDPQAGVPAPGGRAHFPSLRSQARAARIDTEQDEDRCWARDLKLDQIVAAVAGDREERDLITAVLYARLRDAGAVRYRQAVFQEPAGPALFAAGPRLFCLLC